MEHHTINLHHMAPEGIHAWTGTEKVTLTITKIMSENYHIQAANKTNR